METAGDGPAAPLSLGAGAELTGALRARREELGRTRAELASQVGLSTFGLAGIENGHHRPSLERAERLAGALRCDIGDLFPLTVCACGCGLPMIDLPRHGSPERYLPGHNARKPDHGAAVARGHRARRRRLGIPEEKTCPRCERTFTRADVPNQSLAHWLTRRYCTLDCRSPRRAAERRCDGHECEELIPRSVMSRNWRRRFHDRTCGQLDRWWGPRHARDIAPAFIEQLPGAARRVWKLRRAPKPGPRRQYTELQARAVRALREREPTRSYPSIAEETRLSVKQVRAILTGHARSSPP